MFDSVDNVITQFNKMQERLNALVDKHDEKQAFHQTEYQRHFDQKERAVRIANKIKELVA